MSASVDMTTPVDMMAIVDMTSTDFAGAPDFAAPSYTATTPHDIDTATIGSPLGKGAGVDLTGLIVLAPPVGFAANANVDCRYEVWAQDPTCATPPCGIMLVTPAITNPNGTGAFCPYASDTSTALKNVWKGDKVNVRGIVNTVAFTAMAPASGTVVQHQIEIVTLAQTAIQQALPSPFLVTDSATSLFVPYSGIGWALYEATYINLKVSAGKFTTTLDAFGGWACAPGGAQFVDTYTGFFKPDGGITNMYPPNGSMFSAIDGIVSLQFGGGIMPIDPANFHP